MNKNRKTKEVIVRLPRNYATDISSLNNAVSQEEYVYISTKKVINQVEPNLIREAMMRGYVEMSHINLTLASESLHLEYEAEHTWERLVSGG
ncbi:transcriptional regulator [Paenisporosarcina cavernae]|uniref:transcriptional regulator n=1 Tax=Paenisporosarcina cavernae TaxID=2320858 RepID=UPI001968EFFC|nr:transcriptional regulator [Paenisporosarcina cavernae]